MKSTIHLIYEKLLQDAEVALQDKQYEHAARLYRQLLNETVPQRQDPDVQTLRYNIYNQLIRVLEGLNSYRSSLLIAKQYLAEAQTDPDRIKALGKISWHSIWLGNVDDARYHIQQALDLAESYGDDYLTAFTDEQAAMVHVELDEFQEGILFAKKALVFFEKMGDHSRQATLWNTLGLIYGKMGNIYQAMVCNRIFLKFARQLEGVNSETAVIVALNNLGENYQDLFGFEESKKHLQEAMELLQALPYHAKALMGEVHRNYGMTLCLQKDTKKGLAHIYKGFDLNHEVGNHTINTQALYSLAWVEIQWGDRENGYLHARRLLHLAKNKQTEPDEALAYYVLGIYYHLEGNIIDAGQHWQKSLTIAKKKRLRTLIWQLHTYMAQIANTPQVRQFHEQRAQQEIHDIADSIGDRQLRATFLEAVPSLTK